MSDRIVTAEDLIRHLKRVRDNHGRLIAASGFPMHPAYAQSTAGFDAAIVEAEAALRLHTHGTCLVCAPKGETT